MTPASGMGLSAHVVVPERGVDCRLECGDALALALLGPNGSGKSTVLAALAGTLPTSGGHARLAGLDLSGPHMAPLPSRQRGLALVTQRDDLFGRLSVLDNVAFGPRSRGFSRAAAREAAMNHLEASGLASLANRRPGALSGGQARRVSIVRALAAQPKALLLDEPFAGIDVEAAHAVRTLVKQAATHIPLIMATHDAADAWLLTPSVVVLDGGSVSESGPTAQVLTQPRTLFAARMAGRVLVEGTVMREGLRVSATATVPADTSKLSVGEVARVAIAPRAVTLAGPERAGGIPDTVVAIDSRGDSVRVRGETLTADVDPLAARGLEPGARVTFVVTPRPQAYALT
ncbi:ABC transporter ATP-binding protein [Demequina globuliformis]|uniref:ABC transporter ATP-binding protein n=1 Tax=Demequina globuliformis TaxID=676202 RepID=UPI000783E776|nr:ABC transporter ATP-binding protein [Demequina globuliformis]